MFAQDRSPSPGPLDFDVIIKDGTVYDGHRLRPNKRTSRYVAIERRAVISKQRKQTQLSTRKELAVAARVYQYAFLVHRVMIQDGVRQSEFGKGDD